MSLTLIVIALGAFILYHLDSSRVKSSARSAGRGAKYVGRGAKRTGEITLFILSAVFFISIIFEVTGDGIAISAPFVKYASAASDYVNNGLQIIIFSWLAAKVGGRYSHSGKVQYNNNNSGGRGGGRSNGSAKIQGSNFGDQL